MKIFFLFLFISFASYSQDGMVLIPQSQDSLEKHLQEFKYYRKQSAFDFEQFPEIEKLTASPMRRNIRGKLSGQTIILNSYYADYPNLYRINFLYLVGKYYGLQTLNSDRLHVLSEQIDPENEATYKFRRSKKADIKTLIKILEEYKPLRTK